MKVIVFGATGSAGGSVLRACLGAPEVSEVRAITRRVLRVAHAKLRVFVQDDFLDYSANAAAFADADACLFCLGVSSTQVREESAYRRITRDFAVAAARALAGASPAAAFHYLSGQGTRADSRFMWARVKAEAERDLIALVRATCWRPAAIGGEPPSGAAPWYGALRPLFGLLAPFRSLYVSGEDLGHAMLQATIDDLRAVILENAQIRDLADRYRRERR